MFAAFWIVRRPVSVLIVFLVLLGTYAASAALSLKELKEKCYILHSSEHVINAIGENVAHSDSE